MLLATTLAALMIGFLTGLLTLRVARRWCQTCGENLTCPLCCKEVHSGTPRLAK